MKNLSIGVIVFFLIGCQGEELPSEREVESKTSSKGGWASCLARFGKWDGEHKECSGIKESTCTSLGGKFNPCGSPCRHDEKAEYCIDECDQYCDFN